MIDDNRYRPDQILLSYFVKYTRLEYLSNSLLLLFNKYNFIDIYIDIFSLLKKLYNTDIYTNKALGITSCIMNLAAHLRGFYRSRYNKHSRIFIIYSDEEYDYQRQFYPLYGKNEYKNTINYAKNNKLILSQLELVKILCGYIYDIYFISKHNIFTLVAYDLIMKNIKDNTLSILISESKYPFIVTSLIQNHSVFNIRPLKIKGEDQSQLIDPESIYRTYYSKINQNDTDLIYKLNSINPALLSVIWSLNGCNNINVSALTNIKRTVNMIYDGINNLKIINNYNPDPIMIYNGLTNVHNVIDLDSFILRFKAIDLLYQYHIYINSPEILDNTWFINLQDPNTVRDINNKYFKDNPLDLENLYSY